ncbi:MAG TPA: glycerol-3-phosphate dehydrogenase [Beijerinckiaceae bacterium]|nr:glycerol-3-phosphate dehydrogenase [Beijerinckiaceae bacterium]
MFDLLIVGGGINGAGIARDAAGRGLSVMLVEKDDLAGATSSASSKLIHGGLRYLEHYEFRLVREALAEREVLLSIAPHIAWPLTFVLPHDSSLRPTWMIRAGLFLYDHLAPRSKLPGSRGLDLKRDPAGAPLKGGYTRGFSYADCWVQDSRLVVLNALDAAERGATVRTRCRFVDARPAGDAWEARIEPRGGAPETVRARILVNAAGPWVEEVLRGGIGRNAPGALRLVKGSHVVVPRLYDGEHAYILQNPDRRIVFVIPYERHFTLIGTTDVPFEDDPARVAISTEETAYLCESVNRFFERPVAPADVVWSYAGVRPLYDDAAANPSAVTRDYVFDIDAGAGRPPVLSIFGGKITTYRRLAEHALEKLAPHLPGLKPAWTGTAPLPGGDFRDFDAFLSDLRRSRPWLPEPIARRLARAYGTRVERLLGAAASLADLGEDLGAGLTEREVAYLVATEWAVEPDDILWRRGKLGLHGGEALARRLSAHMAERRPQERLTA